MPSLSIAFRDTLGTAPRLGWRGVMNRLVAVDALYRERAQLAEMDDRTLRDIGVARPEIEAALARPEHHLALILARGVH